MARQGPKRTVLVVEDDADIRQIILTRLQEAGFNVRAARSGPEALERVYQPWPDAMVLDINLPELDGFGVLETLKAAEQRLPPTLMLTARHAESDVVRAIKLGAKDYLSKPFNERQLLKRVARLMAAGPQQAAEDVLEI